MGKPKTMYVCSACGDRFSAWSGKCQSCGEWNTIQEQVEVSVANVAASGKALNTTTLDAHVTKDDPRFKSGITEVDNVLGGGIVKGSVNLIAGQPGIGKSTIVMQLAGKVAAKHSVLYVSGEESGHQVAMRAKRLGLDLASVSIVSSSSADNVATTLAQNDYDLVIIDSIQTMSTELVSSQAGSVSQITNSSRLLTEAAKKSNTALIIVGHVTKEGSIAGPKVLEHLVDVVLQLEGDRYGGFKLLRAVKNRFGSTSETGIFEMKATGLHAVKNPSAALLAERQIADGSVVLATVEGTRPLLVEVQALVGTTSFGYAKRTASGMDQNRLNLLIAMLERRTKLSLSDKDVYVNIVGGIKVTEPAADLAVCMAIASASKGLQLKKNAAVFGELGLSGEVRHVPLAEKRIEEAKKLGLEAVIAPKSNAGKSAFVTGVSNIRDALNTFLEK